jgi:hypothetical protein
VYSALFLIESADPAGSWVIVAVMSEYGMDLIDELQGKLLVVLVTRLTIQLQKVADGKSVGP